MSAQHCPAYPYTGSVGHRAVRVDFSRVATVAGAAARVADAYAALPADPRLPRIERVVCLALADGQAPTGSRVAEEHRIARSTLKDALERLLADGRQVQRNENGNPYILDPLFAEWLRRR